MNAIDSNACRVPRLWIAAVALAAALPYALKIAADHDLWWHLRTGQMILAARALPAVDPFSYTAPSATWTNHEWLSDVVGAAVFALDHEARTLSLWRTGLLVAVIAGFTTALWKRLPHPLFVLGGVLLTTPLIRIFVNLRPHSYTYLLAVTLVLLLEAARRRPNLLWVAPVLVVLWTNLHGGFLLGLGILGLYLAERWLGLDGLPAADRLARRRLALVLGVSIAAPVVNPYGPGLFTYLVRELGADHSLILEWQGIWQFPQQRPHFLALCALPMATLIVARRFRPVAPIVLFMLAALATWVHGRFLILLVLFSGLVTFSALSDVLARFPRVGRGALLSRLRAPRWAWTLCALPLLAGALQFGVDVKQKGLRLEIDPWHIPVEACAFLNEHDLGPNLLLRFDWGGYAIWHLYPRYRVSGDGRNLTVYDAKFVDELLRSYDEGRFTVHTERHDVDVILSEAAGPAYRELMSDDHWVRVHEDRVAAVFTRPEVARTLGERRLATRTGRPIANRFYFP